MILRRVCSLKERNNYKGFNKHSFLRFTNEIGYLLFTYSVEWRKSSIEWSKRWMIYFEASNPDASIHWFHIINSTMVVLSLTGICAMIMIRILRKDIADYNAQVGLNCVNYNWHTINILFCVCFRILRAIAKKADGN